MSELNRLFFWHHSNILGMVNKQQYQEDVKFYCSAYTRSNVGTIVSSQNLMAVAITSSSLSNHKTFPRRLVEILLQLLGQDDTCTILVRLRQNFVHTGLRTTWNVRINCIILQHHAEKSWNDRNMVWSDLSKTWPPNERVSLFTVDRYLLHKTYW
jgi:hypothetical protein